MFISFGNEHGGVGTVQPMPSDSPQDCHICSSSCRLFLVKKKKTSLLAGLFYGAGDEARTRYLHLGKVALYRMSYTRNGQKEL